MKPLAIVAFFDGRLGHEKQTRAVLQAMAGITATNVVYKKVPASAAAFCKNWAAYLMFSWLSPKADWDLPPADLLIGTGTHTHIPMLLEKGARMQFPGVQVRTVTCMSPDIFLQGKFDLCCIPVHDDPPVRQNIFVTLGPPCPITAEQRHKPNRGLILVGGLDPKSHKWSTSTVTDQIRTILAAEPAMQWTVSSSPRTPEETCGRLADMATLIQQLVFFRSEDTPAGWVEEQYARNKRVWVTADSISMVYEALSAGCSVGVLPVQWRRPDNKFQKSLDILKDKRMIVEFHDWQTGTAMPAAPAQPLNEAERCAREILKRWWPDRLQ